MGKQFVTTSESPKVVLAIHANLRLKGADELQVVAKADSENDLSIEQQDDTVRVVCNSDCKVYVPRQAAVTVESVSGDATIKGLDGELTIQRASGNLVLHGAGPTAIQSISGELTIKNIAGDLKIDSVAGNATVRDIQGDFIISDRIHGELTLKDVSGSASAKGDGNITLSLDPAPGEKYDFTANGNLLCNLPPDASAVVHIDRGGQVTVKISGVELDQAGDEPIDFTLGDGDAVINLAAQGNVFIGRHASSWDDWSSFGVDFARQFEDMGQDFENLGKLGEQITQQIESQMGALEMQLETQLSGLNAKLGAIGLSAEDQERVAERARQASERASERVQEKLRRAQEKLDRKVAEAQRRAEQRARDAERRARVHERHAGREHRGFHFDWQFPSRPTPPAPPTPPSDPVSDDERMVILRMLEQKKITPEQAEQLLSALEGKGA